jgi:outer membrane lipoprotein SlyB
MNTVSGNTDNSTAKGVPRGVWIGGGVMALAIVALGTTLLARNNDTLPGTQIAAGAVQAAPTTQQPPVAGTTAVVARQPDHVHVRHAAPRDDAAVNGGASEQQRAAPAPACTNCGVIESYSAVQVQGQNNGVGAVIGGVGGALAGSKIAGRGNHTLGGAIGAVGGGLLGNAVESHERRATAYDVQVRMTDGSVRTVRQATVPNVGARVSVDGGALRESGAQQ